MNMKDEVLEFMKEAEIKPHPEGVGGEFKEAHPTNEQELLEFYKNCKSYLISNVDHPVPGTVQLWGRGRILDFGGGAGNVAVYLAQKGSEVDYIDINHIQQRFMRWLILKHQIHNINIVEEPLGWYKGIVLRDVIEHLVDYPTKLKNLFKHLVKGGRVFCKPEFKWEPTKDFSNVHFNDHHNYRQFMEDMAMVQFRRYDWVKSDGTP